MKYIVCSPDSAKKQIVSIIDASDDDEVFGIISEQPDDRFEDFNILLCIEASDDPYEMDLEKITSLRLVGICETRKGVKGWMLPSLCLASVSNFTEAEIYYGLFRFSEPIIYRAFGARDEKDLISGLINDEIIEKGDLIISFKKHSSSTMIDNKLVGVFREAVGNNFKMFRPVPMSPQMFAN